MSETFLNPDDLSEMLGLPRSFIYEHTRRGSNDPLPGFRFGKHLRFRRDEVEKWVEKHRKQ
jgi:excisionase family DNA binding protein